MQGVVANLKEFYGGCVYCLSVSLTDISDTVIPVYQKAPLDITDIALSAGVSSISHRASYIVVCRRCSLHFE